MSTTDPWAHDPDYRTFYEELDRHCPRCGELMYKCGGECPGWGSWDDREDDIESGIPADDYRDEEW